MNIKTKFDVGKQVYAITQEERINYVKCPVCNGTGSAKIEGFVLLSKKRPGVQVKTNELVGLHDVRIIQKECGGGKTYVLLQGMRTKLF